MSNPNITIVKPEVTVIGETRPFSSVIDEIYEELGETRERDFTMSGLPVAELAGRGCYESYSRKNEATDSHAGYMKSLLEQKHHCYSEDTDVLTQDGWKNWSEVSMDDKFATLNSDGEIEYHYPTEIIEEDYSGEMIEYVGKGANLMVTPNHKMLACLTTTLAGRKKNKFSLIPADQLVGVSHAMRKDGNYTGGEGALGESLAWMFGFFAGDGSIQKRWDSQIEFHLSKQRKISRLIEATADLGWDMTIRPEKGREGTAYCAVSIPEDLVGVFREFYDENKQKQIPKHIVSQATKAEARAIIQGLVDSDGSVTNESGSGTCFDSSSKTLRDQFMQLALHAGWAANEIEGSTHRVGEINIINGVQATVKHECKRVALLKEWLRPEFNKKAAVNKAVSRVAEYAGKVYCATVPNHTLYVRRNGKPVWSGNSVLEHTNVSMRLTGISRADSHEIVRHRHFSFCLSGDTKVYLDRPNRGRGRNGKKSPSQTRTLRQLWEMWQDRRRTYVKTATIRSVSPEGHIIHQYIKGVYFSGEKDVYEVELENGYKIKSTMDHLFMIDPSEEKFVRLEDLSVGDEVVVNGRKVELDDEWLKVYRSKIKSITKVGVEETFDLEMDGYHNFVANGFVVHNSQQSQRYVVVEKPYKVTLHPTIEEFVDREDFENAVLVGFEQAKEIYNLLREEGLGRKQASEAARQFLPNAAATQMVITGNLRSWMEFISKRDHPAADASMREVAHLVWLELKEFYPEVFGDDMRAIWDTEFSQGEIRHND